MTVRDHLGRSLAVGSALAVLGVGALTMTERALAVAPAPTGGANGAALTASSTAAQNNKAIGPLATAPAAVSTITVPESAQSYLRDVDVRTFITHSGSGDLEITLTSPARPGQPARTVTLIDGGTNGAGGTDNVFNDTLWDDSSLTPASDLTAALLGEDAPQADLTPEGSLGRFVGIDPRGTWTLRVTDTKDDVATVDPDGGTLASWSLDLATQDAAPAVAPTITASSSAGAQPIPDAPGGPLVSSLTVSGAKTYLTDLDLVTNISHPVSDDLVIRLSHSGRSVLIASRAGGGTPFYTNRTFDDSATLLVNNATDAAGAVVPEGALAAFRGMDPNGVWTLSVQDTVGVDTGTLAGWQLKVSAADAAAPVVPPVTPPVVTPPVVAPPVNPPAVTPQALKLGLKRFGVVKNAKKSTLKLNVVWLNGTGRVNYTATLSTKLGKKTVRKVVRGSGVAGPKSVSRTVKIPKAWKGKKVTVRLVVKNNTTSLVRTKTIARF